MLHIFNIFYVVYVPVSAVLFVVAKLLGIEFLKLLRMAISWRRKITFFEGRNNHTITCTMTNSNKLKHNCKQIVHKFEFF